VVVPSYNRADLLKLTVQSILAQTVPPVEVIIVDDGSTDHTPETCAHFGPPVRYIRQQNKGLPAARNTGIRAAQGDLIAFCDSDDLWNPRKLELQCAAIGATQCGWSLTDFSLIDASGTRISGGERGFRCTFPVFAETGLTPEQHLGNWLERRELQIGPASLSVFRGDAFGLLFLGNIALPSSSLVSRDVIERAGLFDESFRVAEETEFFHRVAAQSPVVIVMKPLTEYRIGHASIIRANSAMLSENAIRSIDRASALRPELNPNERVAFEAGRRRLVVRLAYARLASLDQKGARKALLQNSFASLYSPRGAVILLASLLPLRVLRGLHWGKHKLLTIGR